MINCPGCGDEIEEGDVTEYEDGELYHRDCLEVEAHGE